ncbi:1-acyl-sn-glycerol-3-phosphate acyltransferase [Acidobacteria bacterium ACD]|nr:MAG: 1-acyl-sn-glycerol-3-phosphate acyltransferase [Acidobacteriota bacterium]MCE7960083.1 1-acyl-sn-glycerol-3-phosphate acyltransferase [Acidobacteria bacterium ACB2]MDL1949893.1 1-acyl-sn-glycerol-3-phosphate acyltransferase [Acidobacteria bacterium ACD]
MPPPSSSRPGAFRRLGYRVRFAVAASLGGLAFLLWCFVGAVLALLTGGGPGVLPWATHSWAALLRLLLGWRLELEGRERLRRSSPAVFAGNHQSALDTVLFASIYPPRTVTLGKKEVLRIPFFGWFFVASGNILVDRGNLARARESIREAARRMTSEGLSVLVFPEGHRNLSPRLLPFKKGPFHLAIAAGAPVVPIVMEPIGSLFRASRWMARSGRVRGRVLPEIPTEGLGEEDVDALARRVQEAMQSAFDELAQDAREPIG